MQNAIKNLWNNDYAKGGVFLTVASLVGSGLNYIFNFTIAHSLGPRGYGEIVAFNSYLGLTSIPITVLSTVLIQKISSSGRKTYQIAGEIEFFFLHRLKRWGFFFLFLFLIIPFVPRLTNLSPELAYFLVPTFVASLVGAFYSSSLNALKLFTATAVLSIIGVLLKLSGALLVATASQGLPTVTVFLFLSAVIPLIGSAYFFRRKIPVLKIDSTILNKRLKHILLSRIFILTTLSVIGFTFFGNVDIIFVKKFFSPAESGIYSAWNLFSKIIFYLLGPIVSVSFIFFSGDKGRSLKPLFYTLLSLCGIFGCAFIAYTFFDKTVILILFGAKFLSLQPYLQASSIFGFFYALIVFLNSYFLAKKHLAAVLLTAGLPFYVAALFIFGKNIEQIIFTNISFAITIAGLSLISLKTIKS